MSLKLLREGFLAIKVDKSKTRHRSWRKPVLKRKYLKLYSPEEITTSESPSEKIDFRLSQAETKKPRFILEIFPDDVQTQVDHSKRRKSKILEPKLLSFWDISCIQRTNLIDCGAFLCANENNLQITLAGESHSDTERWLNSIRDVIEKPKKFKSAIFDSREYLVSILDTKTTAKMNLSGRYWVAIDYVENKLQLFPCSDQENPVITIEKSELLEICFADTRSKNDWEKILELSFYKNKRGTSKRKLHNLWLFCNDGQSLNRAIRRLLVIRSQFGFPYAQESKNEIMKILDGPETKTFRKFSPRKSANSAGNTSPRQSGGGFLNSFLRKSLTSLTEFTSNSSLPSDSENISPTSKNRLSGNLSLTRKPTPPSLPSKQELERKESDRLYQEFLLKEWSKREKSEEHQQLSRQDPTPDYHLPSENQNGGPYHEFFQRKRSEEKIEQKRHSPSRRDPKPEYHFPKNIPVPVSEQNSKLRTNETASFEPSGAEYHLPIDIPITVGVAQKPRTAYTNLTNLHIASPDYNSLPLAPRPSVDNGDDNDDINDDKSVHSLSLDSPLRPLPSDKRAPLQAVENNDYHILSQFITDKEVPRFEVITDNDDYCKLTVNKTDNSVKGLLYDYETDV